MIQLRHVTLNLGSPGDTPSVRFELSKFEVEAGEAVALTGPSGCGKSTLVNLIAGLRRPDEGEVTVAGVDITTLSAAQLDRHRGAHCGMVFQSFHLLAPFTALENVGIGLRLGARKKSACRERAQEILCRVGLEHRLHARPGQLSVGEKQRVAIARALAARPQLLLADEPTAALDSSTGREVVELLKRLAREQSCSVLMVTHDPRILDVADRLVKMEDGRLLQAIE